MTSTSPAATPLPSQHDNPPLRASADTLLSLPYETWNFGDSVAFEALVAASAATGDESYLRFAQGWVRAWATRATPFRRLDCTAPGTAMMDIYHKTGDPLILQAATALADYLLTRPQLKSGLYATWVHSPLQRPYGGEPLSPEEEQWLGNPPAGAFIDCLHFDPPFLTALGKELDRSDLVTAGIEQASAYIRRLQRPDGLFDHFELDGVERTFGTGWGRGQGWALLGLLDVIGTVGADDERMAPLRNAVLALSAAMIRLQRPSGHWGIDVLESPPEAEEYSTAAFMAVGFTRMVVQGLVTGDNGREFRESARRARAAVLASLQSDHALPVSVAVMASTRRSHYAHVPNGFITPWGQGPLVLMLAEVPE